MRSVVVVLPASMWAMIPMLRVFSRGNSRAMFSCLLEECWVGGGAKGVRTVLDRAHRPGREARVSPARRSDRSQRPDAASRVTARIMKHSLSVTPPSQGFASFLYRFLRPLLPAVMRE